LNGSGGAPTAEDAGHFAFGAELRGRFVRQDVVGQVDYGEVVAQVLK